MRHVLVDDDTLDEGSILERASDFAVDLDEFKVNIAALEVCNREDCINGDGGKLVVSDRNTTDIDEFS